jgi:hypothetical protein
MDPSEQITNQEKMIKNLELELNDLRQGLTTVQYYYSQLESITKNQEAAETIEEEIVRPQADDEKEFDSIWQFHEEMLVADPSASIPSAKMYDAFVQFCKKTSHHVVDRPAFEFIFARMENPHPEFSKGKWKGYRIKR